jgi:hypothetical protein
MGLVDVRENRCARGKYSAGTPLQIRTQVLKRTWRGMSRWNEGNASAECGVAPVLSF